MTKVTYSKEDLYIRLAVKYGWSHETIVNMNPYQQYVYLRGERFKMFENEEEYNAFVANRR